METREAIAVTMLACGELAEVAGGLRADVVEEAEDDATEWPVVDGDIELGATGQGQGDGGCDGSVNCGTHEDIGLVSVPRVSIPRKKIFNFGYARGHGGLRRAGGGYGADAGVWGALGDGIAGHFLGLTKRQKRPITRGGTGPRGLP